MATPRTYYIYFHSGDFIPVPDSQPPTLVDEAIKAGYYRDLSASQPTTDVTRLIVDYNDPPGTVNHKETIAKIAVGTATSTYVYTAGLPTPTSIQAEINGFHDEVVTSIPLAGGAAVLSTGATGKLGVADDQAHIGPRPLSYTKSAWQFLDAAGNLLARPLYEDVKVFSTAPPNGVISLPDITAVTPSDSAVFTATNYIYITGAGNLALLLADGVTSAIIPVVANTLYDFRAIKIKATGTTATGILRW